MNLKPGDIFINNKMKVIAIVRTVSIKDNSLTYFRVVRNEQPDVIRNAELRAFTNVVTRTFWKYLGSNLDVARLLYNIPVEVFNEMRRVYVS